MASIDLLYEKYPTHGRQYLLEKWFDNCDSKLSRSDQIILCDTVTSERIEYHVDEVKTDLIISPKTTLIILDVTKDFIGKAIHKPYL